MKIRDVIKLIEEDGWYLVVTKGSHRQYKHPVKPGRVTIAGHPSDDLAPVRSTVFSSKHGWRSQGKERATSEMYRFLVVIEQANGNYSAYSPDLPGCVATGKSRDEATSNMYEAIEMHVRGLLEDALPVPESHSFAEYVALPSMAS
jgi:predicted RNase H-like HicB family nuclease/predicted RNA binding protein YcfA (HicA-like mRNA interferase family)